MSERLTVAERIREAFMDGAFTYERSLEKGAEFDRWLANTKAAVWDEGFAEGLGDGCTCDGCLKWVSNPYREQTK